MVRIKKIAALVASVTALGLAGSTFAAVPFPIGWYIQADGGYSKISNKNYGGGTSSSSNGLGWDGVIGYKFMPYLAGEVGYIKYADVTVKNAQGRTFAKDTHNAYDIAAKGILPLCDSGAEVFAKLGAARFTSHTTITNTANASTVTNANVGTKRKTALLMALGADYSFMPYLQGVVQWTRVKGNSSTGDADLYTLGLAYIFS